MAITPEHLRWKPYKLLLIWMKERHITMRDIADKLALESDGTVRGFLQSETMPTGHHARLIALGVPENLLPKPLDRKPGRKSKAPRWPGKCLIGSPEAIQPWPGLILSRAVSTWYANIPDLLAAVECLANWMATATEATED